MRQQSRRRKRISGTLRRRLPGAWRAGVPGLLAIILAGAFTPPASGVTSPERPPLVSPANNEHHVGKIIYLQLMTPDLNASKRFYAALFGWTFQDVPSDHSPFAEALLDGTQIAGLMQHPVPKRAGRRPAWMTFISVRDVDAVRTQALQHGAKLLLEPRTVPGLGRIAIFTDPQGAVFAVLASSSGDPPDTGADNGSWIWSSLLTRDPAADASFYRAVFGYDVYDVTGNDEARHLILGSENFARASINPFPSDRPNLHPRWINYIRVDDAAAMATKVESLGGHVLVPTHADRDGSLIAIVADPLGAVFGLLQWSGSGDPGAPK